MLKEITNETINNFLNGFNPMERIITIECGYMDSSVFVIYVDKNNTKKIKKEDFYPFVWAKQNVGRELFGGNRELLIKKMKEYGIWSRGLIVENNGKTSERLQNGYRVMFYAKKPMSYNKFMKFFNEGGKPIYGKDSSSSKKDFLAISPVEQHMMRTGERMFKGYDDYDQLLRLSFDLETEGLDPKKCSINQIGIRTNRGFEKIITITGKGEEKKNNELSAIREFLKIIGEIKPDVVTGQNSENFDWNFLIIRLELLGTSMEEESQKFLPKPVYKKKKQSVLKLGGEMEYYYPTVMWGFNITDSLHAIRRAQAIDSDMKKADLKYVTKYSNLNKPNRVYVPGDKIRTTWEDNTKTYAFNNANGKWFKKYDKMFETYVDVQTENGLERVLKYSLNENGDIVDNISHEIYNETVTGTYIVERYLLDDLYETDKVELRYNQSNFLLGKLLPTTFSRVCTMGTAGTWKLIMLAWSYENDLAIPDNSQSASFTGGLSRLLCVGYIDRVVKLDYNSLYPSIILTWLISTDEDIQGVMLKLLEYILTQREKFKELKGIAGKKAKKIQKELEKFIGDEHDRLVILDEIQKYKSEESANDKKQLPFKIFGNSFFGGFGAPNIFNWGDLLCAENTTCNGRQSLRLMIKWFTDRGYKPIVGDTDGFNFQMPSNEELATRKYIGKGLNRNTEYGKEYAGVEADVAEFNDLFMRGKMGLGIDEYALATINFSRKNYADYLEGGKTKLVGNTIKSKKMPVYIENFINKGVDLLLHGNGYQFLQEYYNYIEKIYNLKIPLREIASKGKIKKTVDEYKKDCQTFTSAGQKKSRQAWYELVIKDNVKVDLGETIYYINTGKSKSHSDIKRVTHYYYYDDNNEKVEITKDIDKEWTKYRKQQKELGKKIEFKTKLDYAKSKYKNLFDEDELIFNCILLDNDVVEAENDTFCTDDMEYNVEKYIEQFNKRVKPLLVCFSKTIRDEILIKTPDDRKYFTEEESKLVSNEPYSATDQDTYEQLMTIEDKEIKFWIKIGKEPPFVKECGIDWEAVKKDYIERCEKLNNEGIKEEVEKYKHIISNLTNSEIDNFIKNGTIPKEIDEFLDINVNGSDFISKKYKVSIGTIYDILDKVYVDKNFIDKNEAKFQEISNSSMSNDEKMEKASNFLTVKDYEYDEQDDIDE